MSTLKAIERKNKNGYEKNTPLIEEAYRNIKSMIFEQKVAPGQRLVYQDLARILEISQTPIINALNRLYQDGFITYENFCGFYVKPIDLQEVWDAFGVREALEVYSVKQAIERWNAEGMALLMEKFRDHEGYVPHHYTRKRFLLDSQFHLQIATVGGNRVLRSLLKRNFEHIYLRARLENYDPKRMGTSAEEHHRLLDRMKKKDVVGSIEIMRTHIQNARDQVIRCLSSEEHEEERASYLS